ncbi:MAG TPA: hypothetical protein VF115_04695, partial [Acidimicrobiia bacterium]
MTDKSRVIAEIERYWLETGLATASVDEMKAELEWHLVDAELDGRTVDEVIGDRAAFAEGWAAARRGRSVETWADVQTGRT